MNCWCDKVANNATLCPIVFNSKSLLSAEQHYSNIECEALGILQGLETFHCCCFAREVCFITDHRLLIAILSKDVAMLFQHLQHIMLQIHQ